jgi:hypothetical protein
MDEVERWARDRGAERAVPTTCAGSPLSVPFSEQGMGDRRHSIVLASGCTKPPTGRRRRIQAWTDPTGSSSAT